MILTFTHKGLQAFFQTGNKAGIRPDHAQKLTVQLQALNHAKSPNDMNVPSWKLHPLHGQLETYWAITVNANWRLIFRFTSTQDVDLVNYQDYH